MSIRQELAGSAVTASTDARRPRRNQPETPSAGTAEHIAAPTPGNREALERLIEARFSELVDIERFVLAVEGSQDGIWDWNLEEDTLFMSVRLKEMLGYTDGELPNSLEAWHALLHPDDDDLNRNALRAHLRGETDFYKAELRVRRKDGDWGWMYIRGRGVRSASGEVRRIAGAVSDISQRKSVEEARADAEARARRAQNRLADAISVSVDGFALFDSDDRLVMFNGPLARAFGDAEARLHEGLHYSELMNILARNIVPAEQSNGNMGREWESWLSRQFEYHKAPVGNIVIENRTNSWFSLTERKTNEGGTVLVLTDITAMKLAERDLHARVEELQLAKALSDQQSAQLSELAERLAEAKEVADAASRTKSEFLANMSHELRTPLNAIMGFSEVIKNELFGPVGVPQYKQYSDDIYESGSHLLAIINDILDLSKVEAGKFDLSETEIQVTDLCRSVLHIVKGRADEAGITLIKGLHENLPYLLADPRTLKQMLLNLLSNAIKFTSAGGTVDLVASLHDDGGFRFDVRDTGIGIPAHHFQTVLSPFGQVDTAHARDHQGTGLGLPLVQAFIKMHGGRIEIQSEVGEGTTISLFFPPERTRKR